jgi:transmembrane sensor
MTPESVITPEKLQRYREATDWLVRLKGANPCEADVECWLAWCEADARNPRAFEEISQDWNDLEGLKAAPELIRKAEHHPPNAMNAMSARGDVAPRRRAAWLLAFAAAATIIVVAGYPLWNRAPQAPRLVIGADWKPAVLPDGSSLVLSAKAAAEVDFTGPGRNVLLRPDGEAYIKVHHDPARPFVVRAGTVTVRAVGTAFDVRRDNQHVSITVEEGTVRIVAPGPTGPVQWQASAGYQIDYSERAKTALVASVDAQRVLQWRTGQLAYDRTPLSTVIADINRYSTARVVIGDPELEHLEFSGTVFVASIGDWLGALQAIYPVRAREAADGVVQLLSARDRDGDVSRRRDAD